MQASLASFASPGRALGGFGIEPGMIVADFGAGSGAYTLLAAEALGGFGTIYAVDVHEDLLRKVRNEARGRGFSNVEIVRGDIERPRGSALADHAVDLVLMSNVLFQLEDKTAGFSEAWRVLKPTGTLILIEWDDLGPGERLGPSKEHLVPKRVALELARGSRFEPMGEFPAGSHHYGLAFRPRARADAR